MKVETKETKLLAMREGKHFDEFRFYCRAFYEASIGGGGEEERKNDKEHDGTTTYQRGKIVLDALDRFCMGNSGVAVVDKKEKKKNSDEKSNFLRECGLCERGCYDVPTTEELDRYIQIRNEERSNAHKLRMKDRQVILLKTISRYEQNLHDDYDDDNNKIVAAEGGEATRKRGQRLTRVDEIRGIRDSIRQFVRSYGSAVGSHSFLAGIRRLCERQLKESSVNDDAVLRWTFDSSAITECHILPSYQYTNNKTTTYLEDAVQILTSFLMRLPHANHEQDTIQLSWQIHPALSNVNLRRIIADFPPSSNFHANPTGLIHLFHFDDGSAKRRDGDAHKRISTHDVEQQQRTKTETSALYRFNANGQMDESSNICQELYFIFSNSFLTLPNATALIRKVGRVP